MIRRLLIALFALNGLVFAASVQAAEFDATNWDALLKKHVVVIRDGQVTQVDYAGFKADRESLKAYLRSASAVSRTEFDQWRSPEQLAFLINAYNAWTVELVLGAYPGVISIKDLGSFMQSPWKKRFIPLLGETRSLDDIEHGLIRDSHRYNDPRIHFAVNCASIGCPALRPEAYAADRMNSQLEDATQKFLSDRTRNRFEAGTLKVSSIFKWYREDFERGWHGIRTLGQFLALYRQPLGLNAETANGLASGKVGIDFLDYDWRLNGTTGLNQGGKP